MSLDPTYIPDQPYNSDAVNRARNLLEAIPETVGPYRILERIGTGGMGEVYRAEQRTPIRREVALKLIKLGMDTKLVIARFEAERQALALMDHPHIAKVFDANADDAGRPYFVMEYVKGKPITEYADHQRLSIPERLELFEQVCQAVQHAHHKGVIHRDLKPSNVLVCTQDGKPFSKVIDFGVAKAIVQRLTEKTFFTEDGQFVGTPHYMSPEQAEGSIDIDTRTDVYSLGVLLYELLTGSTPFAGDELRKAAFDQLKRMVIEVDPPKPSTRLLASSASGRASALRVNAPVPAIIPSPPKSGEKVPEGRMRGTSSASPIEPTPLETLARHRSTEPKRLSILVRGELDWIVMKALEKDRKRRYETPSSLATDIRSHLSGGTVLAAPPSLWYRTQKFARKYRYALIGTGTAFALLLLAVLGTTYGLRRARIAEAVARDSETDAIKSRDQATKERDAKNEALTGEAAQRALADQERELAERQLIDGLLRPIGFGDEPNTAELRSFVDWSQIPDARLKLRVLDVAFENPEVALRLARRAERAMQACIGLSPTRRAKAIEILTAKQRDMQADPRIRVAAAWLAIELGSADVPALPGALTWLSDPTAAEARPEFTELSDFITNRVETLSPDQITRTADVFINMLGKAQGSYAQEAAGNGLAALAPKLNPDQVARGWDALIAVLNNSESQWHVVEEAAGNGLVALAPKLSAAQVTQGGDALIAVLAKSESWSVLEASADGLVALAPKLSAEQVTRGGDALIAVMEKPETNSEMRAAGNGLAALAPKLSAEQVMRGLDAMLAVLDKSEDGNTLLDARKGLVVLAPKLSAEQVTYCGDALIAVLNKPVHRYALYAAGDGLVVLAPKLSAEQVTRGWDALIAVLDHSEDESVSRAAGNGLVALAPKLSAEQVTRGGDALIAVLDKSENWPAAKAAGIGLAALAPKMSPEQVTHAGDALIAVLDKSENRPAAKAVGIGLVALAPRLSAEQMMRGGDALIGVLTKTQSWSAVEAAADGLVALAPMLSPEQITHGWDALISLQEKSKEYWLLAAVADGLVALAPELSAEQRVRTAEGVLRTLRRNDRAYITPQLPAFMPHLEPGTQDRFGKEALLIMLDFLGLSERYFFPGDSVNDIDSFRPAIMAMNSPKLLARLMQHPACIGEPREWMLQRFEELVLHDGNRVFLNLPEEDGEGHGNYENPPSAIPVAGANAHGGLTPNRSPAEPPPRRFHTMHDAAAWIQQNWPDFDLEATHPVIWRGEM